MAPRTVTFLNRFYWPDVAATGQMLADLAEDLAAAGWEVTVIASAARYEGGAVEAPRTEVRRGVRVVRVGGAAGSRHAVQGRLAAYVSYLVGAVRAVLRLPRPGVIVALTDPPMLAVAAALLARVRGARAACWAMDLYPELLVPFGMLRADSRRYRVLRAIGRWGWRQLDATITLGPSMSAHVVAAGADPARVRDVPNWAATSELGDAAVDPAAVAAMRETLGAAGRCVVLYSGNAGRGHAFESVVRAAHALAPGGEVAFAFVGGGEAMPRLQAELASLVPGTVRFQGYVPREQLGVLLAAADVALVTEAPEVAGLLLPSKLYGVLAAGRPVVFVGSDGSDVARTIREADAGVSVATSDADALATTVLRLARGPDERARLGANARRAAVAQFDRHVCTARWGRTLIELLAGAAA